MLTVSMAVCALVRVHVYRPASEVVVLVVRLLRRELPQQPAHVPKEQRLVLVDLNGGGGVLRKDGHLPELDARSIDDRDDVVRYVDELRGGRGLELKGFAEDASGRGFGARYGLSARFQRSFHYTAFMLPDFGVILDDRPSKRNSAAA